MSKMRRFIRLPADWEDLGEEDIERLCDRADRLQGILPELPPLEQKATGERRDAAGEEDEADEGYVARKRRRNGVDRETMLEQQDERGD